MQKKEKYRNMTQVKWAELIRYTIMRVGIVLSLDEIPRRYISREFLTLRHAAGVRAARKTCSGASRRQPVGWPRFAKKRRA